MVGTHAGTRIIVSFVPEDSVRRRKAIKGKIDFAAVSKIPHKLARGIVNFARIWSV
jgi:hypothetical protein